MMWRRVNAVNQAAKAPRHQAGFALKALPTLRGLAKLKCLLVLLLLCLFISCKKAPSAEATQPSDFIAVANELEISAPPVDRNMQKLVNAYPEFLLAADGNKIIWKDGTTMLWDDGKGKKSFEQLEADPDLEDMFLFPYPKDSVIFRENYDPGRIRNEAFFKKMYGGTQSQASAALVSAPWVTGEPALRITHVNGVNKALQSVVKELEQMPAMRKYLTTPGGTFNWRTIAGTTRLSAHSFGMAVDINVQYSDYWRWSPEFKAGKALVYHNQIPMDIVRVFERHGFIWGGKWYHYDTMHFEYRPELTE
jgi:peptidoglycan LD-endopeptidase CwlK